MTKFIQTSEHVIIGQSGAAAATLAPGERVAFNEEAESHKEIARGIESGDADYEHLSIVDIDVKDEKKQEEEQAKMLEKAEKIAAKQRDEELQEATDQEDARSEAQEDAPQVPQLADADPPPQDVEAQRLAKESGAGQRASTQEDVAKEDKPRARKSRG